MRPAASRWRQVVLIVAASIALGACAGIPTSGSANEVADDSGLGQSTVRYSPALPVDDASPSDIVRGYLDAMLAYPVSTRTAAAFLTPEAAKQWQPQQSVTIYESPQVAVETGTDNVRQNNVSVTVDRRGVLNAQGRFAPGGGDESMRYTLEQYDGQWRISNPQPGLMVTEKFFTDYFRAFDLFYFDAGAVRLSAIPVHLAVDERLAAALVSSLAVGPGVDHLTSFLPPADELRPTVPVENGIVDVGFESPQVPTAQLQRMSAQLTWTLRQVPALESIRISLGAGTLEPETSDVRSINDWERYDNSTDRPRPYAVTDDRVVALAGGRAEPIDGPWGESAGGATTAALSEDSIALGSADGATVQIGDRQGDIQQTISGTGFLPPVVDGSGNFWIVDRAGDQTRVRMIDDDQVRTLPIGDLAEQTVQTFAISPDGARYLAVTADDGDTELRTGAVTRNGDDEVVSLTDARAIEVASGRVLSAAWVDGIRVAYVGQGGTGRQLHTILIDGSTLNRPATSARSVLPDVGVEQVSMGSDPNADTYVRTNTGQLWFFSNGGVWSRVASDTSFNSVSFGQ